MSSQLRDSNFLAELVAADVDLQLANQSFPETAFVVAVRLEMPYSAEDVTPAERESIDRKVKVRCFGATPLLTVAHTDRYAALVVAQ